MNRRVFVCGAIGALGLVLSVVGNASAAFPWQKKAKKPQTQTQAGGRTANSYAAQTSAPRQTASPSQPAYQQPQRAYQPPHSMPARQIPANTRTPAPGMRQTGIPQHAPLPQTAARQTPAQPTSETAQAPQGIQWQQDLHAAHKLSVETGRPMLIVFGAEWCHFCKKLESETLSQPELADYVSANFIPVHLDLDRDGRVAEILEVKPIPCTVVLSPNADLLGKVVGFYEPDKYRAALDDARTVHQNVEQARFSPAAPQP